MKRRPIRRKYLKTFTFLIVFACLSACRTLEIKIEGIAANNSILEVNLETPPLSPTSTLLPVLAPSLLSPTTVISVTSPINTSTSTPTSTPSPTPQPTASPTRIATVVPPTSTPTASPTPTFAATATALPLPPTATQTPSVITTIPTNTSTAITSPLLSVLKIKVIYHDADHESSEGVAFYQAGVEPWLDLLVLLGDNNWYGPERQADEITAIPLPNGYHWETDGGFSLSSNGEVWWNHNSATGQASLYYGDNLLKQQQLNIEFIGSGGSGHRNEGGGSSGPPTIN